MFSAPGGDGGSFVQGRVVNKGGRGVLVLIQRTWDLGPEEGRGGLRR